MIEHVKSGPKGLSLEFKHRVSKKNGKHFLTNVKFAHTRTRLRVDE